MAKLTSFNSKRNPQAKLQFILRHSARVFAEKGFERASIRDISRASSISLAGLYHYFDSKQEILYLIQVDAFSSIVSGLQEKLEKTDDPVERLRLLIRNHINYFLSHPAETKVLAHEEHALDEPYRKEIAEIKRRYYQLAREVFEALPRNQGKDRVTERVALLSLFGMMNWIYMWYNPKVDPQADRLADLISTIFLQGVADCREGREPTCVPSSMDNIRPNQRLSRAK